MNTVQETKSNSKTTTPKTVKAVSKNADAPIAEQMRSTLHETVDTLAAKAQEAEKTIRNSAENSKEVLSEKQQQIQASWEASSVRKFATENPVATAGIVFVAGALFGKMLSRS